SPLRGGGPGGRGLALRPGERQTSPPNPLPEAGRGSKHHPPAPPPPRRPPPRPPFPPFFPLSVGAAVASFGASLWYRSYSSLVPRTKISLPSSRRSQRSMMPSGSFGRPTGVPATVRAVYSLTGTFLSTAGPVPVTSPVGDALNWKTRLRGGIGMSSRK